MDEQRSRTIGATWVMGLIAVTTLGFTIFQIAPQASHATVAAPTLYQAARTGLTAGLVAGLIGWLIAASLTQTAMLKQGLGYVVVLIAGVILADISAVGWIHMVGTIRNTIALQAQRKAGGPVALTSFPQYRSQMALDREAYHKELYGLGYPLCLRPDQLAEKGGLASAAETLKKAQAVNAKYRALYLSRVAALTAGAGEGAVTADEKRAAIAQIERTLKAERQARLDWWDTTDEIMAEQQADVADLAKADGAWEAKGSQLMFHAKSDYETFHAHGEKLKALQDKAHTLDLAVAHESDKADMAMLGGG